MDDQNYRRWEVKDTFDSDWRTLPGEFTARDIWAMRDRGDFWIAIPLRDVELTFVDRRRYRSA